MIKRQRCSLKRIVNILCVISILWLTWFFFIEPITRQQELLNVHRPVTGTTRSIVVDIPKKSVDVLHHVEKPVSDVEREFDDPRDVRSPFVDMKHNDVIEMAVSASGHQSTQANTGIMFVDDKTVIKVNTSMTALEAEQNFHEFVSQIHVNCGKQLRVGNVSDGGWDVCIAYPHQLQRPCLVYSFGIGDNWSFDDDMATKFGCTVRSFDPSINKQDHVRKERVHFYNVGISDTDGFNVTSGWTVKTMKSLLAMCHDDQKIIDYLKLDVESNEWAALEAMLDDNVLGMVKQLAIEIHTKELNEEKSTIIDLHRYWNILNRLETIGFRKWYWHFNTWGFFPNRDSSKYISCCYELVYINVNYL